MSLASFQRRSILYGYSLSWIVSFVAAPYLKWPDLSRLQEPSVVFGGQTSLNHWLWLQRHSCLRYWSPKLVVVSQTSLLCGLLVWTVASNGLMLAQTELANQPHALSYKFIYSSTIANRAGLLITTLLILLNKSTSNLWMVIVRNNILSTDERTQLRLMVLILSSLVADGLLSWLELLGRVNLFRIGRYSPDLLDASLASILLTLYLALLNIANVAIRYRPFVDLVYVTLCLCRHIELLHNQLATDNLSSRQRLAQSKGKRKNIHKDNKDDDHHHCPAMETIPAKLFSNINNLYELEHHLTQLVLFLDRVDRQAPSAMLILTTLNLNTFLATFFYLLNAPPTSYTCLGLVFLFARLLPLLLLFLTGQRLKTQSQRLVYKLEQLYLEGPSECLIYKQLAGDSVWLLNRIFKLLDSLRISCDQMTRIDLSALGKLSLYTATAILIVVQYDSFDIGAQFRGRPRVAVAGPDRG